MGIWGQCVHLDIFFYYLVLKLCMILQFVTFCKSSYVTNLKELHHFLLWKSLLPVLFNCRWYVRTTAIKYKCFWNKFCYFSPTRSSLHYYLSLLTQQKGISWSKVRQPRFLKFMYHRPKWIRKAIGLFMFHS